MNWRQQSVASKSYLVAVYALGVPAAWYCLSRPGYFSPEWFALSIASVFVATINIRLPKISAVISMGDVFVIIALLNFGPAPALVTYWIDITSAHFSDVFRKYGRQMKGKILLHRFLFNVSCCAFCITAMDGSRLAVSRIGLNPSNTLLLALFCMALSWFFVNTVTISAAISFWMKKDFFSVWREGLHLCLLNFIGSAAAAGLIISFYERMGVFVFLLSVPMAVVFYQLYFVYITKYEQAQTHIADLNKLYLQTIDAMATAVDAKDR